MKSANDGMIVTKERYKIENYLYALFMDESTKEWVSGTRKRFNITKNVINRCRDSADVSGVELDRILSKHPDFQKVCTEFCSSIALPPSESLFAIYAYLIRDRLFYTGTLFQVHDVFTERRDSKRLHDELDDFFPISIRISPYTSERDIIEYVKSVYTEKIAPLQKKYSKTEIKIGSVKKRNRSIVQRDQFVRSHIHLPLAKLNEALKKECGEQTVLVTASMFRKVRLEKRRKRLDLL